MRKQYSLLLAIMAMLLIPAQGWSEIKMTFSFVNSQNEVVTDAMSSYNTPVSVYVQGERVSTTQAINDDNWNFTGSWTMTFADDALAGKTASYETYFGQRGTFTVTEGGTLTATLAKLTVVVKDSEGQPITDAYVRIYDANGSSNSYYTNYDGQFTIYYAPMEGFRWTYGDQSGNFDLAADYTLTITKQATTTFNLQVKGRHGDYPLGNRSYSLYKYGDTKNEVTSFYGSGSAKVDGGDYWVKDNLGVFSDKFTVSSDMTFWLDYHMVTFTSMTGTTPNANQQVTVYYNYNPASYNYDYQSANTNDKGVATMYLQAGNYTYRHLGTMADFTVGSQDQDVAIKTSSLTITLDCSATEEELEQQNFYISNGGNDMNFERKGNIITVAPIMAGNYTLTINNYNKVDITVAEGENAKTVKLYALQFTTNIETTNRVSVNDGNLRMDFNKRYFLPTGDYTYAMNYYGNPLGTVSLTQDTSVPMNYGVLTVTVRDSKGIVEGQQVNFGSYSRTTDENGQVTFTELLEPTNQFTLSASDCYVSKDITLQAGEQTAELTVPDNVSFNVLYMGQPLAARRLWVVSDDEDAHSYSATVENGAAQARLDPSRTYRVEGYHGVTAITEGSTISLGRIEVTCDGMGIALPMENWDAVSAYPVLVGTTVRLAAIPVYGTAFQNWDINNGAKTITEGMVDLKITEPVTTAKAVFGGTVPTKAPSLMQTNADFSSDGRFVYLPENTEGTVRIFATDGKLMKSIGVDGNQVGIYDLPAGAYVFTLSIDGGETKVARFIKK